MTNRRIETLWKQAKEIDIEFGRESKEWHEFNEKNQGFWRWARMYRESVKKGFDEIVVGEYECVHEGEVAELLDAARQLKIEYFVFACGFSGVFSVVNEMTKHGAKVGKFVVKTYEEEMFGKTKTVEVSGLRINL